MGVADLRKAFNEVAEPRYSCRKAYMHYEPVGGEGGAGQFQVLTFSGTGADGNGFTIKSEQFNPNLDPVEMSRVVAQALLDKQEPLT